MKIFDTQPQEGLPVRHPSFFKALVRMAKAWETLSVDNGYVSWSNGAPRIVVEQTGGAGGTGLPSNANKNKYMGIYMSADNATADDDPALWEVDWLRAHG